MAVPSFVTLLMIFVVFHSSEGHSCCDRRRFVPKFAKRVISNRDLEVRYRSDVVECGHVFNQLDALRAPNVTYDLKGHCKLATILGITPDLVNPLFNPYVMYLVHNVPSGLFKNGFKGKNQENVLDHGSDKGDYGAAWITPKFVSGTTGLRHNTVLYFLYCQKHPIDKANIKVYITDLQRSAFKVKEYADEKDLGDPVAVTYNKELAANVELTKIV